MTFFILFVFVVCLIVVRLFMPFVHLGVEDFPAAAAAAAAAAVACLS